MKDLRVLLFIISFLFFACGQGTQSIPDSKYFSGKVIIKAEKNSPLGLIKLMQIYSKDSLMVTTPSSGIKTIYNVEDQHMSEPSKAVLYAFDKHAPLDLGEKVWVSICEKGGVQMAKSYKKQYINGRKVPPPPLFDISERHKYISRVQMNLHNADKHREGPKHKKIHTGSQINLVNVSGFSQIKQITVFDPEASQAQNMLIEETYYIPTGTVVEPNTEYFTQFSYRLNNTIEVHTFDIEHVH